MTFMATGDNNQRYKVQFYADEEEGALKKGWNNFAYTNLLESAQAIAESAISRPGWIKSRVIDRENKDKIVIQYRQRNKR